MKIYKHISIILMACSALLFTVQCTDSYDRYNKTGVNDEEGSRDQYFLKTHMTNMQSWIIPSASHANQFSEQLLGGPYGGYFSDVNPGFNNRNFSTYGPEDGWYASIFKDYMKEVMTSYNTVKTLTEDPVLLSVASITKVAAMSRITDIFGPIPYTEVGVDGALNAKYDSQEDVYKTMLDELDEAIDVLTVNRTNDFSPKADRIYSGNVERWIKYANSIKLRMAIRMSEVEPLLARTKAEEVMSNAIGPILSNDDNANLTLVSGQTNPYAYGFDIWNSGGDARISADITSYMNGYNDPRMAAYFEESAFGPGVYVGFRNGISIPAQSIGQQYSRMNPEVYNQMSMRLMNAAEIAFLRAEGALRGWNMGGTAQSLYESGIELSFGQWGVSGAAAYIANATSSPLKYVDPLGSYSFIGSPSTIKIAWSGSNFDENLERIITQKWIANYPNGIEAWSEFRRTGYPKLMPVLLNRSSVITDLNKMARRLPYPNDEYTGNRENVLNALSTFFNAPDNMATDVWWANNPANGSK
ncbi:RagB/SusD family nutrient uptake outer membrane protein [Dysgonomonas sp. 25]|uniref:RagB/SusD family nutrient uptake outer membrane protein n=1 Tax=Dysgonomonas sp. 25 TaxID=2302933 RepID=UPI0013D13AF0|nr:RagB/SusD family nutrient uptake outer membrane protein [Dysgonomonas sp. 25]NDV69907.1 SusD/RagB family nutrient-binding outer membrane lipoprotein [Dysgonomonas sp. 25]